MLRYTTTRKWIALMLLLMCFTLVPPTHATNTEEDQQHEKSYKAVADVLSDVIISQGRSTLDVGCGHGNLVEAMYKRGLESYCLKEDSSVIRNILPAEYLDVHYRMYNVEDEGATRSVESTDTVTSFEVAQYVRPEKASQFIKLLTSRSPRLILFGAATKNQDKGMNPYVVNANTFEYWIHKSFQNDHTFLT